MPCKCFIERSSRTPVKSLGKDTSSFLQVKQTTLHSSAAIACCVSGPSATSPLPHQAQLPRLKGSSGAAQPHSLGLGCWEKSHVGKHHVRSVVRSPSTSLESRFSSQLLPLVSARAMLLRTDADPDPNQ